MQLVVYVAARSLDVSRQPQKGTCRALCIASRKRDMIFLSYSLLAGVWETSPDCDPWRPGDETAVTLESFLDVSVVPEIDTGWPGGQCSEYSGTEFEPYESNIFGFVDAVARHRSHQQVFDLGAPIPKPSLPSLHGAISYDINAPTPQLPWRYLAAWPAWSGLSGFQAGFQAGRLAGGDTADLW